MPQVKAIKSVNTGKGYKNPGDVFSVSEKQRQNMLKDGLVVDHVSAKKESKEPSSTKEDKTFSKRKTK